MKKLLLISALIAAMPLSMQAQDDDLYFVPKKRQKTEQSRADSYGMPRNTYYVGSSRSVDEYNRRHLQSRIEPVEGDSTMTDVIDFSAEKGVYPDSVAASDYPITRELSRFDDYSVADNAAFWAGYEAGRDTWGWHSPWYYSRYGFYDPWYDPWYWNAYGWRYGFYDPWYWGWGYPHYYRVYYVGGGRRGPGTFGAGTIRRDGGSHGYYGNRATSGSRLSQAQRRQVGNHQRYGTTNNSNRDYNYSRDRDRSYSNFNNGNRSTYSGSSFGGSRSSGGSFGGGSRSGGGGGGSVRMGGRR